MWGVSIIDGTGPGNWTEYIGPHWFQHSFCRQIYEGMEDASDDYSARYQQGPTWDGFSTEWLGGHSADYIEDLYKTKGCRDIILAGYSRGAAAQVEAAQWLNKKGITVKALFLFDPVGWYPFEHCDEIPDGVENVFIARRDLNNKRLCDKYPDQMRASYGETSKSYNLRYKGRLRVNDANFPGSHGALGGTGWANMPEDAICQNLVGGYMNAHFKTIGLGITLRSYPCTGGT